MSELVERYVYQVGRFLPEKERGEIEKELRSLIQDQLDDRYPGSPSQAEVASVLKEFGDPRQMAASYSHEKYLIGPELYPMMMLVLRRGWLLVPTIAVAITVFGRLISAQQSTLIGLFIETVIAAFQAIAFFSVVVVLIFAIIQHTGVELKQKENTFNPLDLPAVNYPGSVDRVEVAFGMAIGMFVALVLLYFASVGGLTLRLNLSDPGEVIPVPMTWLVVLIVTLLTQLILHLIVLRRNHWSIGSLMIELALELISGICLYVAVLQPVSQHISAIPQIAGLPIVHRGAEIVAFVMLAIPLVSEGSKLIRLWNYQNRQSLPTNGQTLG